jgi:hypothetical protein
LGLFHDFPDRELQREKVWSRIHLVPLLLAEGDRDAYRRQQAALQREREIMKDVKGWEVSDDRNPACCESDKVINHYHLCLRHLMHQSRSWIESLAW